MKKLIIAALITLSIATSCHPGPRVTISSQSDNISVKLTYSGNILLSPDQTRIESISNGGFINYDNNGDKLDISRNPKGGLSYALNGDETGNLNSEGQALLAEAIKMMANEQAKK